VEGSPAPCWPRFAAFPIEIARVWGLPRAIAVQSTCDETYIAAGHLETEIEMSIFS
jgi:hypothetical protein